MMRTNYDLLEVVYQMELHKVKQAVVCFFSKKCLPAILLTQLLLATACTSNDLDKYRDNGLLPRKTSTIATVHLKAKAALKERDEESVGDALDELANFLITTSPVWLP